MDRDRPETAERFEITGFAGFRSIYFIDEYRARPGPSGCLHTSRGDDDPLRSDRSAVDMPAERAERIVDRRRDRGRGRDHRRLAHAFDTTRAVG